MPPDPAEAAEVADERQGVVEMFNLVQQPGYERLENLMKVWAQEANDTVMEGKKPEKETEQARGVWKLAVDFLKLKPQYLASYEEMIRSEAEEADVREERLVGPTDAEQWHQQG